MNNLKLRNKHTGEELTVDTDQLRLTRTKTLYIRKAWMSGKSYLSQRGTGMEGAGDICNVNASHNSEVVEVNRNLFSRILIYAAKASKVISTESF